MNAQTLVQDILRLIQKRGACILEAGAFTDARCKPCAVQAHNIKSREVKIDDVKYWVFAPSEERIDEEVRRFEEGY